MHSITIDCSAECAHNQLKCIFLGRCVRGFLDVSSFLICLFLVILQLGLIDYYYLTVLSDKIWYSWIGADFLVIVVLLWLLVLAVKYNQTQMEEVCSVGE